MIEVQQGIGLNQEEIQAMLSGPDYFTCERTHTRMKKEDCVIRQTKGLKRLGAPSRNFYDIPPECWGCEQGKKIIAESKVADSKKENNMEEKICKIEGCDRPVDSRGLCSRHYQEWLYNKDRQLEPGEKVCSVPGCNKRVKSKGLCGKHYDQNWHKNKKREKVHVPSVKVSKKEEVTHSKGRTITLQFDDYPDILSELEDLAREEFRPVDLQIMFIIKKGLANENCNS